MKDGTLDMPRLQTAFTLVELLVVITIIVILLALLTPALDQAVYQAELAVCGTNLRSIGSGATVYAMNHQRRYPHRSGLTDPNENLWEPRMIATSRNDDRPELEGFISLDLLVDPLTKKINLDRASTGPNGWVYSTINLWFDWRYSAASAGMHRVGDRFTAEWAGERYRFGLLADDHNQTYDQANPRATHPDALGVMANQSWEGVPHGAAIGTVFFGDANATLTGSVWLSSAPRGPIDNNYLHTDGSVDRITGIEWGDDRFVRVPYDSRSGSTTSWLELPQAFAR